MTLSKEDVEKELDIKINSFDVEERYGMKTLVLNFDDEYGEGLRTIAPLTRWGKEVSDENILESLKDNKYASDCNAKIEKDNTPIMGDLLDYDRENHLGRFDDILGNIEHFISNLGLDDYYLEDKIRMEVTSKFRGGNGEEVNKWCNEIYHIDITEIDPDFWENMKWMYRDLAKDNDKFLESGEKLKESEELKEDPTLSDPEKEMSEENPEKKAEDTKFEEPETFNECNCGKCEGKNCDCKDGECDCEKTEKTDECGDCKDCDEKEELNESEELKEDPILAKPENEMSIVDPEKKEEITTFVEPKTFNPEDCAAIFAESKKLEEAWFKDDGNDRDWAVCKVLHGKPHPVDKNGELKSSTPAAAYSTREEAEKAMAKFQANPENAGRRFFVTDDPDIINGVA